MKLIDDNYCIGCGSDNPHRLGITFKEEGESLRGEFVCRREHQGFQGILHGGIMMLALDEVMVNMAWRQKLNAVSGDIKVKLKAPVSIGSKIVLTAKIKQIRSKFVTVAAEASVSGRLVAEAEALCIRLKQE